jgi:glycosyltransferase involved in cell wall biosynthesis
MIRVCHISSVHCWNDTRIFFKECVTLANNGYHVTLIATNTLDQNIHNVFILGVENKYSNRLYRATIVSFRILRKAFKTKSKIYHFHDPELIWVGMILKLMGKNVVYDVHENLKAQIFDKKWLRFPKFAVWVYSIFELISSKMFHIVIAEDSYEENFMGKAKSITKVLNFPDIDLLSKYRVNASEKSENGILYVGLVSEKRGIIEIIQALEILKKRQVSFTFHCIGPMSEDVLNKIEQLSSFQEVKNSIVFYGRLPVDKSYLYSEKSKVALSILHPVPNYIRSYSTKIFEYMAIGIPFIVSDFKLYEFIKVKQIGFLVNPLNPIEIASHIEKVLKNEINVEEIVNRGIIEVANNYSWKSQAKNLLELYTRLS